MRHVLLTLSTWGDTAGDSMFPGIETLAVATQLNRDTVGRVLKAAVNEGWVIRAPRGNLSDPVKAARLFGYRYSAAVPDSWAFLEQLEHRWEQDPTWVSERRHRPRRKQGRVPVQNGDNTGAREPSSDRALRPDVPVLRREVPAHDRNRPRTESEPSRRRVGTVPVEADMTSSSTSSVTSSHTSSDEGAHARRALVTPIDGKVQQEADVPLEMRLQEARALLLTIPGVRDSELKRYLTVEQIAALRAERTLMENAS